MQREGLGMCGGSELYFKTKTNCTEMSTTGSMALACSEAQQGTEGSEQLPLAAGLQPVLST